MPHRIVIAGGGVAALEAAVALHSLGGDAVSAILVTPNTTFSFPAWQVGEPFGKAPALRVALDDVLADLSTDRICDSVVSFDMAERTVQTADGDTLPFDGLLLAIGGTPFPAYAHGISFDRRTGPETFDELLRDVEDGLVADVAFVVPEAEGWTLPAYDLALMLRAWASTHGHAVRIRIVTAEQLPLECFGPDAAREVGAVLDRADVQVVCGAEPVLVSDTIMTASGHWLTADRIVSLPRLAGPRPRGVPCDLDGFIRVDERAAVQGCAGVYAAGDGAVHTRKQGGLAAQQADQAVRGLLRDAGMQIRDLPGPPVLRGALATPEGPLYLEASPSIGSQRATSIATFEPVRGPHGKVATRWLGPHLEMLMHRRLAAFAA